MTAPNEEGKEKILPLLRCERELLALRANFERVQSWLAVAQSLPQVIDRKLPIDEIYARLRRSLIAGLRMQSVVFFELDGSTVRPLVPPGSERSLSGKVLSFLNAAPFGVCNEPENPALLDVAESIGLHRFLWARIQVSSDAIPILMAVGFTREKAKFQIAFDEGDAANIGNLARHLEMLLGNMQLLNQVEKEKESLLQTNETLEIRDRELLTASLELYAANENLERKVQERTAELAQRSRDMRLVLDSAEEGFLGINETGTVIFANMAAGVMLGVSVDEMVGKAISQVVPHECPSDRPCDPAACPILKPFSDGCIHRVKNSTFRRRDGSALLVDFSSSPAREDANVINVVLTFRDMTQQRKLEARALQGEKLQAIGQLAAGIAHEINTPMQYIGDNVAFLGDGFKDMLKLIQDYRGIVDVLKQDPAKAELVHRVDEAEEAADIEFMQKMALKAVSSASDGVDRVRKIVYAMKEFSHPGGMEKQPADLNRALENAMTISAYSWKGVAAAELNLSPSLPPVNCQIAEVNQVILNLIVNAAHAIADCKGSDPECPLGKIHVETEVKQGYAEMRITDTGGGISESIRHRIFEPFFTTKEVGRGTGQGLAMARTIIEEKHGGYIDFATEVGKGTTFIVGLPLSPDWVPTEIESNQADSTPVGKRGAHPAAS